MECKNYGTDMSLLVGNIHRFFIKATGIRDFTLYPFTHFRYLQNSLKLTLLKWIVLE